MRILVCDDSKAYRELLGLVLSEDEQMEPVAEATNGQECVEAVQHEAVDVVLLDQDMPIMTGLEALPVLREVAPEVDVIMLSSAPRAECEREAVKRGARGYIEKPASPFDIPEEIRRVLGKAA